MRRSYARFSVEALALLLAASAAADGCRPSESELYGRTFPCDSTATTTDQCGTNARGKPMVCFAASQLGATDFCADTCDGAGGPTLCSSSGVGLETCHPSQQGPGGDTAGACGGGLSCYRNDLQGDRGFCVTGDVCTTDADCKSKARTTCASTLIDAIYPQRPPLALDHLSCVETDCALDAQNCPAGEVCLPSRVPPQAGPADVCLPLCDSELHCPPTYVCFPVVSGPAAPPVCLPGLLGFKCSADIDCMLGACVDTGTGIKTCSVPCDPARGDADCSVFDGSRDTFVCTAPAPGAAPHCMTPSSFGGAPCAKDDDCRIDGSRCMFYSPYGPITPGQGICLLACDAAGQCPARGGIPHACLDFLDPPVCYPGRTGVICHADADCAGDLRCLQTPRLEADDQVTELTTCAVPCASDEDCAADPFGGPDNAWCDGGVCVLPRPAKVRCQRDIECASAKCAPSTDAAEAAAGVLRCTQGPVGLF
jgi:hypothetical protein